MRNFMHLSSVEQAFVLEKSVNCVLQSARELKVHLPEFAVILFDPSSSSGSIAGAGKSESVEMFDAIVRVARKAAAEERLSQPDSRTKAGDLSDAERTRIMLNASSDVATRFADAGVAAPNYIVVAEFDDSNLSISSNNTDAVDVAALLQLAGQQLGGQEKSNRLFGGN